MSDITTDFIKVTKKIHADVRAVLTTLHLIREDVKVIREHSGTNSDEDKATANHPNPDISPDISPSSPDQSKANESNQKPLDEKRFLVEKITLSVLAIYTALAGVQTCDIKKGMHIDKRAWIDLKGDIPDPTTLPDNCAISTPVHISNTGRTPAWHVEGKVHTNVLPTDQSPDFTYQVGTMEEIIFGVILPNAPAIDFPFGPRVSQQPSISHEGPAGQQMTWTTELKDAMRKGSRYVEVHGRITYRDAFGTEHWIQFCRFIGSENFHFTKAANDCVEYNNVDNNQ
jgi:hypothetical protein